jgi:hypothetical protein
MSAVSMIYQPLWSYCNKVQQRLSNTTNINEDVSKHWTGGETINNKEAKV